MIYPAAKAHPASLPSGEAEELLLARVGQLERDAGQRRRRQQHQQSVDIMPAGRLYYSKTSGYNLDHERNQLALTVTAMSYEVE